MGNIKKIKLKNVADIYNGARITRYNKNLKDHKVLKKINSDGTYELEYHKISNDINPSLITQEGDIIIQLTGFNNIVMIKEKDILIPMNYCIIRTKKEFDNKYLYHMLCNIIPKNKHVLMEGSVLPMIRISYLNELEIPIVENEKQEKIGKLLSLFDKKRELYIENAEYQLKLKKIIFNKINEEC